MELLERRAKKIVQSHRTNHTWILQNILLISNKWKSFTVLTVASNSSVRFCDKLCNHIKGQIRMTSYSIQIWSVVIQCCFVSNGNGFQNRVICLRKFNQAQPWKQHWYNTSSDCGVWETLWLLTELIYMALTWLTEPLFIKKYSLQPDSLTPKNKQVEALKSTGRSTNKAEFSSPAIQRPSFLYKVKFLDKPYLLKDL